MVIYGLLDPRTGELRYVGKTDQLLKARLQQHLQPAYLRQNTHKNAWVKALKREGLRPEIVELEVTDDVDAESFWIAYYSSLGCNLTNGTAGGEGWRKGTRHTAEAKQKISEAFKGRKKAYPAWNKGRKIGPNPKVAAARSKAVIDDLGRRFESLKEAAAVLDCSRSKICDVLKGRLKTIKGRTFKYET